jgi:uncharacterized protein (DUF302 family)
MNENNFIYEITSKYNIKETIEELEKSLSNIKFGILAKLDLGEKMRSKNIKYSNSLYAFEVCNPIHASNVLSLQSNIKFLLPCKITVSSDDDNRVTVGMVDFTMFDEMFEGETKKVALLIMKELKEAIDILA